MIPFQFHVPYNYDIESISEKFMATYYVWGVVVVSPIVGTFSGIFGNGNYAKWQKQQPHTHSISSIAATNAHMAFVIVFINADYYVCFGCCR